MPLPKSTKTIIAIVVFVVLAALVGGSIYWRSTKAKNTKKIGIEETSTKEDGKAPCTDCAADDTNTAKHPKEPLPTAKETSKDT